MNAKQRRKHDRALARYLLGNGPAPGATAAVRFWRAFYTCFNSVTRWLQPELRGSEPNAAHAKAERGDLSGFNLVVNADFTRRYPRAAAVLPEWYRRTYARVCQWDRVWHESPPTHARMRQWVEARLRLEYP